MRNSRFWKNAKDNVIPFMFFAVLGLLLTIGMNKPLAALGVPAFNFMYLGFASMIYSFFFIFPKPSHILGEARENEKGTAWRCPYDNSTDGTTYAINEPPACRLDDHPRGQPRTMIPTKREVTLSNEHIGLLTVRGVLKTLIILFVIIQFSPWGGITNNLLIPTALMFGFYFTLPTRYKTSQPDKIMESWFRMLLGFMMAVMLMSFFANDPSAISRPDVLFGIVMLVVIGFLMSIIDAAIVKPFFSIIVNILLIVTMLLFAGALFVPLQNVPSTAFFFLTFAYFATMPVREEDDSEKITTSNSISIRLSELVEKSQKNWDRFGTGLFIGFVSISMVPILTSWLSGMPVQVMIIFALLFILSMFTGTMSRESRPYVGAVVLMFAIFAFSFAYTDTVGTAVFGPYWGMVQNTATVFFGPISEQMDRASCEAYANYLCISQGPSVCADEKLKCTAKPEAQGSDRAIEFQNFKIDPPDYWVDGENTIYFELANNGDYDANDVGFFVKAENGWVTRTKDTENEINTGTVTLDENSCIGGTYDKVMHACWWLGKMPKKGFGAVIMTVNWTAEKSDKGLFPKINMTAAYNYDVRSSYTVDVRSTDELKRLMLAGESLSGTVSQYSGGPITASLWTPKYVESKKSTLVMASLENTKNGVAYNPYYCIYVPEEGIVSEPSVKADVTGGECEPKAGARAIRCSWDEIREVSAVAANARPLNKETCEFRIALDIGPAAQKQLPMVGEAHYTYAVHYDKKDVMFAFASGEFLGSTG